MRRKRIKIELLEHQSRFVNSTSRYLCNSGGVGSGKTYSVVLRALDLVMNNPNVFGLIGAQTYPLLRDTTLREFINIIPPQLIKQYNKTEQHFKFRNGSEVIFRAFDDPTKLKSLNLGFVGVEEMTDINEEVFKMLRTRLRQDQMPCCLFGATNPGVFDNWVYKYFIEKPINNSEIVYSISSENKFLPSEYLSDLEELKKTNPEYYERMVMGKWGSLEGMIYNLPIAQRIEELPDIKKYHRIIAGLDFGFTHPMAMCIFGIREDVKYLFDEVYRYKMSSGDIIQIVKDKMEEYDIEIIYCDPSRPELIEDMQREGIPAEPASNAVFEGIMHVKTEINTCRLYVSKDCHYALREFDSYIWDAKNTKKEVPLKVNDHSMDAIRYGLYSDARHGGEAIFNTGDNRVTSAPDW